MTRRRLSDTDWQTVRRALNDAMDERASFSEAYGDDGPECTAALKWVKRYEALHVRLFGEPSARQRQLDADAEVPTISVFDLMKRTSARD